MGLVGFRAYRVSTGGSGFRVYALLVDVGLEFSGLLGLWLESVGGSVSRASFQGSPKP